MDSAARLLWNVWFIWSTKGNRTSVLVINIGLSTNNSHCFFFFISTIFNSLYEGFYGLSRFVYFLLVGKYVWQQNIMKNTSIWICIFYESFIYSSFTHILIWIQNLWPWYLEKKLNDNDKKVNRSGYCHNNTYLIPYNL